LNACAPAASESHIESAMNPAPDESSVVEYTAK
jgi:hypothetical protein